MSMSMKTKSLPIAVVAFAVTSILGSTGCVGTVTTVSSNGQIRVKDLETGEIRLNRAQLCATVTEGGRPLSSQSIDIHVRYKVNGRSRRTTRAVGLNGRGEGCFTVQFSQPVAMDDIEIKSVRIEVFGRQGSWSGRPVRTALSDDHREGRVDFAFDLGSGKLSALDPDGELATKLSFVSAASRLRTPGPMARTENTSNPAQTEYVEVVPGESAEAQGAH